MNSSEKSSIVCIHSEEIVVNECNKVDKDNEDITEDREEKTQEEDNSKKIYSKSETVEVESDSDGSSSSKKKGKDLLKQDTFLVEKEEINESIKEEKEEQIEVEEKEILEIEEETNSFIDANQVFLDVSSCSKNDYEVLIENNEIEKKKNDWKPMVTIPRIVPVSNSVSQEDGSKIDWEDESDQLNINWNKSQIKTCIRIKPMDTQEIIDHENDNLIIQTGPNKILINYEIKGENKKCEFAVDKVFRQESSQMEIWKNISFCIDTLFEFKNATVFAHGHTGTGKTYTMIGPDVMELIKKKKRKTRSISKKVQGNEILLNTNSLKMSNGTTSGSTKQNLPNTQIGIHRKRSCSQPILILPSKFQPQNNINSINYKRIHYDPSNGLTNKLHGNYKSSGNADSSNECNYYTKHENYKTFEEYINDMKYYVRTNHDEVQYVLNSEKKGMIPRACEEIMKRLEQMKMQLEERKEETGIHHELKEPRESYVSPDLFKDVKVYASYMQLYNDRIFDLLNPYTESQPILNTLKSNFVNNTTFVSGLLTIEVTSVNQLIELLIDGTCNRACRITKTNEMSTRSHSIFKIELKKTGGSKSKNVSGNLLLIDLAGNEKYEATNEKLYSTEVCSINRSLSALSLCINELSRGNKSISYRNSILTRLLQGSLGGSSKTVFICTVSSCLTNVRDTISSLQLAAKAKKVQIENKKLQTYLNEDTKKLKRELNFLKKFVFFQYITNKYENRKRFQKMKNYLMNQVHKKGNLGVYDIPEQKKEEDEFDDEIQEPSLIESDPLPTTNKTKEHEFTNPHYMGGSEEIYSEERKHMLRTCEGLEQIYQKCEFSSFGSLLSQWDMNKSSIKKVQWKENEKNRDEVKNRKESWFTSNGNINRGSILDFIETHTIEYEMESDEELEKDSSFYDSELEMYDTEHKKELVEEDLEKGDEEEESEEEGSVTKQETNGSRVKSLLKKMVIEKEEHLIFSEKKGISNLTKEVEMEPGSKGKSSTTKKRRRKGKNKNMRKEKSNSKKPEKLMTELQEVLQTNFVNRESMNSNIENLILRKEEQLDGRKEIEVHTQELNKKGMKPISLNLQKYKLYNSLMRKKGIEDQRKGRGYTKKKKEESLSNNLLHVHPEEMDLSSFESFEFSNTKEEYKHIPSRSCLSEAMGNKRKEYTEKNHQQNHQNQISESCSEHEEEENRKDITRKSVSNVTTSHNIKMKEIMNQLNRCGKYNMFPEASEEVLTSKKKCIKNTKIRTIEEKSDALSSNEIENLLPGVTCAVQNFCVSAEHVNPRRSIKNIGINNLVINKIKDGGNYKDSSSLHEAGCISEVNRNSFRKLDIPKSPQKSVLTKRMIGPSSKEKMLKNLERKKFERKNKEKENEKEECNEEERGRSISESAYYSTLKNKTIIGKNNKGKFTYYIEFENALASNEIRKDSLCNNRKRITTNTPQNPKKKNGKAMDLTQSREENEIVSCKKSKEFLLTDIEKSWLNFERKLEDKLKKNKKNKEWNNNNNKNNIHSNQCVDMKERLYDECDSKEEEKETYDLLSVIHERKSKLDGIKNKYNQLYLDVKTKGKNVIMKRELKEIGCVQTTKSQCVNILKQEEMIGNENKGNITKPTDVIRKDRSTQEIKENPNELIGEIKRDSVIIQPSNQTSLQSTFIKTGDAVHTNKNYTTNVTGSNQSSIVDYMKSKEMNRKYNHTQEDSMKVITSSSSPTHKGTEIDSIDLSSVRSCLHNSNQTKKELKSVPNGFIPNEKFHSLMQKDILSKKMNSGLISGFPVSLEKQAMVQKNNYPFSSSINDVYVRNGVLGRNEMIPNGNIYYRYTNMKTMNPFALNKEVAMRDLYHNYKTESVLYNNSTMGNVVDKYVEPRCIRMNEIGVVKGKEMLTPTIGMTNGFSTKKMHKMNFFYIPESNEKNNMNMALHPNNMSIDTYVNHNNRRNTVSIDNGQVKKGISKGTPAVPKTLPTPVTKNLTAGNAFLCNNSSMNEGMKNVVVKYNTNEIRDNKIKNSIHYSNTVDLVNIQIPLSTYINSNHMDAKDGVPLNIYSRNPIKRNLIKTEDKDFDKNIHSGILSEMNKRYTAPLELFR